MKKADEIDKYGKIPENFVYARLRVIIPVMLALLAAVVVLGVALGAVPCRSGDR